MARKWLSYPTGTPQHALLSAVEAYDGHSERFFEQVAKQARVSVQTASGTFYAVVRLERRLPENHRAAYLELLPGLDGAVLDELECLRQPAPTPGRRDRLSELEAQVAEIDERQQHGIQEVAVRLADLEERLARLERQAVRRPRVAK